MKKILVLLFVLQFLVTGCKEKKENIYEDNDEACSGFTEKIGFFNEDDEWLHTVEIFYGCSGKITYFYDAYNIKHKSLDKYKVKYIYEDNTVVYEDGAYVSYSLNEDLYDELLRINEYLTEKQFSEEIDLEDLEDIKLEKLDKNKIIKAFNDAITSNIFDTFGPYMDPNNAAFFEIVQDDKKNPVIQFARVNGYGYYQVANIEIIYDNNVYLSDLVKVGKASKKQIELYNNITKIEEKIIEVNNLDVEEYFDELDGEIYNRIFKLLKSKSDSND